MRQLANFDVKMKSSIKGMPTREYVVQVHNDKGITVRIKNKRGSHTVPWEVFFGIVLSHYGSL